MSGAFDVKQALQVPWAEEEEEEERDGAGGATEARQTPHTLRLSAINCL